MAVTKSNNLKFGSRGDDVYELQRLLNNYGYGLDMDGKYGEKTQSAVQDYQSKNGLSVDGIVGTHTWGKLNTPTTPASVQAQQSNPAGNNTSNKLASLESSKPTYQQSDAVKQALDMLTQQENNKPGDYQSSWDEQIKDIWNTIQNRGDFQFDISGNPLYEQYKDQYIQNGKLAMQDYMAQNAALSGGYGSSWGATAGNLANQAYLSKLNDVIPELYDVAYSKYRDEGTDLYNQLGTMMSMDEADYGKYRDQVGDYYTQLQYLANKTDTMSQEEYNKYLNDLSSWQTDRGYYYGKEQDEINLQNYLKELAYKKEQDALAQSNWEKQFSYQQNQDSLSQQLAQQQLSYQQQQEAYERELAAAQLAASVGDYSKLEALGINPKTAKPKNNSFNANYYADIVKDGSKSLENKVDILARGYLAGNFDDNKGEFDVVLSMLPEVQQKRAAQLLIDKYNIHPNDGTFDNPMGSFSYTEPSLPSLEDIIEDLNKNKLGGRK